MKDVKGFVFDAYGTLFDVYSVGALGERLFPGHGAALAQLWRAKQLQYSLLRSLMGRHRDFWGLTEDGLVYACKALGLDLTADARERLLGAYLTLAAFPDVKPGLEALRERGLRLAILSNGEPKMLEAAAQSAGILPLLDRILSVEEVGVFKPSPRVYALAPARLGASSAELGFVSRTPGTWPAPPPPASAPCGSSAARRSRPRSSGSPPSASCTPSPTCRRCSPADGRRRLPAAVSRRCSRAPRCGRTPCDRRRAG